MKSKTAFSLRAELAREIAKRQQAEAALRQSEARFQQRQLMHLRLRTHVCCIFRSPTPASVSHLKSSN